MLYYSVFNDVSIFQGWVDTTVELVVSGQV